MAFRRWAARRLKPAEESDTDSDFACGKYLPLPKGDLDFGPGRMGHHFQMANIHTNRILLTNPNAARKRIAEAVERQAQAEKKAAVEREKANRKPKKGRAKERDASDEDSEEGDEYDEEDPDRSPRDILDGEEDESCYHFAQMWGFGDRGSDSESDSELDPDQFSDIDKPPKSPREPDSDEDDGKVRVPDGPKNAVKAFKQHPKATLFDLIRTGDVEGLKAIIALGANLDSRLNGGSNVLEVAVICAQMEVLKYLLQCPQLPRKLIRGTGVDNPLFHASFCVSDEMALLLLAHGADPSRDEKQTGLTPFHIAAYFGNKDLLIQLNKSSQRITPTDSWGRTPLMFAAMGGHLECLDKFDIRFFAAKDADGNEALHYACGVSRFVQRNLDKTWHGDLINLLYIRNSKALTQPFQNKEGRTPFMIACAKGSESVAHLMLALCREPLIFDRRGYSALHLACFKARKEVIEVALLVPGAHVGLRAKNTYTPLRCVAKARRTPATDECIEYLLSLGADPVILVREGRQIVPFNHFKISAKEKKKRGDKQIRLPFTSIVRRHFDKVSALVAVHLPAELTAIVASCLQFNRL